MGNINNLLKPLEQNAYQLIANDNELTVMRTVIDAAGLDGFFKDQSPITVFAPTDTAFNLLGYTLQEVCRELTYWMRLSDITWSQALYTVTHFTLGTYTHLRTKSGSWWIMTSLEQT